MFGVEGGDKGFDVFNVFWFVGFDQVDGFFDGLECGVQGVGVCFLSKDFISVK
jgi:hypothetical protein